MGSKRVSTKYDQDALLLNFVLNVEKFFGILFNMAQNFYAFITQFSHTNHPIGFCRHPLTRGFIIEGRLKSLPLTFQK